MPEEATRAGEGISHPSTRKPGASCHPRSRKSGAPRGPWRLCHMSMVGMTGFQRVFGRRFSLTNKAKIWQSTFASGSAYRDEFPGKFPVAGQRLPCRNAKRPAYPEMGRSGESTRSSTAPMWNRKYLWNQWVPCCLRVPMMHFHGWWGGASPEIAKIAEMAKIDN